MITYVFPGQGAQVKGMGEELFDEFANLTKKADCILGFSIKDLCLNNPDNNLDLTQYTQPALYVVNALTYYKKCQEADQKPEYLAGHSLGEYNALLAAGVFDFETGLKLVKKRGELMARVDGGAMAAVIGLKKEKIKEILDHYKLRDVDIANLNTKTQIVISGYKNDIDNARQYFECEGGRYIILKVSAAFHSRYMRDVKEEFEEYLKEFQFSPPAVSVISNLTAEPYEYSGIKYNMANQLRSSVKWYDSIEYILNHGGTEFIEAGPGQTLKNMINKIKSEVNVKEGNAALRKVNEWNRDYPIGTKIICRNYTGTLKTRTEALVLFGHRAAVYVKGYNGYFDLDEISAEERHQ